MKIAQAGLMAALCYIGYAVFPAISASGSKIHIGNAFVVLSAYLLGGVYGGLSGAVGLSIADIVGGYAASAPRTFITKLVIGLIVGFVAHKIAKLSDEHDHAYVIRWSAIAAVCGLGFNCFFEPALKYVWYTLLFPNADKAASAIKALLAPPGFKKSGVDCCRESVKDQDSGKITERYESKYFPQNFYLSMC